ncbi:MAG TPA: urease accessory protein UreE [Gammaproteobacteria bacterium]|nr:urease accessory protein UreE [Gammaproteobacteria bacterium]
MLDITERLAEPQPARATLTLPFELRQKSRLRCRLDDGREVGLLLPRGTVLRSDDCLRASNGEVVLVQAAAEEVSTARAGSHRLLLRAAYHLGNRHVPVQLGEGFVRYLGDHVLDRMLREMGLQVGREQAPFEPESGAYRHEH